MWVRSSECISKLLKTPNLNDTRLRIKMKYIIKYINTPPNPLFLDGELIPYISMAYFPSIKRELGGVLLIQANIQLIKSLSL
jgi:hypothetical protein